MSRSATVIKLAARHRPLRYDTAFESSRNNKTRGKTQKRVFLDADKQKRPFRRVILKPFVGLAMLLGHLSPDVPARKDSPSDWS